MTIPVQIEFGNHAITASLHALPRVGDKIFCAFPSSGVPKMFLVVTGVHHRQSVDFDGKECPEPFWITLTTDGDPAQQELNDAAIASLLNKKA